MVAAQSNKSQTNNMKREERQKRRKDAIAAIMGGEDIRTVAEQYGYAITTLYQYCHKAGVCVSGMKRSAGRTMMILSAALKGECGAKIAERFGVSRQRVNQVIMEARSAGIEVPRGACQGEDNNPYSQQ